MRNHHSHSNGSTPRYYRNPVKQSHLDKITQAVQVYKWNFETACSWQGVEADDVRRELLEGQEQ